MDIENRIWEQTPRDAARELRTIIDFKIGQHIRISRPASFLISVDHNLYIVDNNGGKLFKVTPDFLSITELGINQLSYPTMIREARNELHVYDNYGINIIRKDGQLIRIVKSYLKIEDFDIIDEKTYIVSLAELKRDIDPNFVALIDWSGKRIDSMGEIHSFEYPNIENRAFLHIQDGKVYVCYKFDPLFEIYDLRSKALLHSFNINASIFPRLVELKQDKKFVNPEPGIFKIPRFVAGFRIVQDKIFILLHTPNPEIVEFTLDGKEVRRFISSGTKVLDYFGFDVLVTDDVPEFFVGTIDYSSKPSLVVYEESSTQ